MLWFLSHDFYLFCCYIILYCFLLYYVIFSMTYIIFDLYFFLLWFLINSADCTNIRHVIYMNAVKQIWGRSCMCVYPYPCYYSNFINIVILFVIDSFYQCIHIPKGYFYLNYTGQELFLSYGNFNCLLRIFWEWQKHVFHNDSREPSFANHTA